MQKIRSLVLAASLLASIAAGTTVLTLTQSAAPALAATPHCDPYCVGQPTAPALAATVRGSSFTSNQAQAASTAHLAVSLNFAKIEM